MRILLFFLFYSMAHVPGLASEHNADTAVQAWYGMAVIGEESTPIHLQFEGNIIRFSLPERATYGYPSTFEWKGDQLRIDTPFRDNVLNVRMSKDRSLTGTWELGSVTADVRLSPVAPTPLPVEREVRFHAEDGTALVGSLIMPPKSGGTLLTVVMGHGSPPDTRMTQHYLGRARWMARNGVAAFIWDKRGAGESEGDAPYLLSTLVSDFHAAIRAARQQPEVDQDWIIAGGFSQAGFSAPIVANEDQKIAGVLVGSAPAVGSAEQNVYSLEMRLPEKQRETGARLLRETYEFYRTGRGYEELIRKLTAKANAEIVDTPIFRRLLFFGGELPPPDIDLDDFRFMFFDPLPEWRKLDVPVLSMWGSEDRSVPSRLSYRLISEALSEENNPNNLLLMFEGGTHGLMTAKTSSEPRWTRTAPGFQEMLIGWLLRRDDERRRNQ